MYHQGAIPLGTGIQMSLIIHKKELHLQENNKQLMILKGVYKIYEIDLEKIHQEIRIRATMDYFKEV